MTDRVVLQNRIALQLTESYPAINHSLGWHLAGEVMRVVVGPYLDELEGLSTNGRGQAEDRDLGDSPGGPGERVDHDHGSAD